MDIRDRDYEEGLRAYEEALREEAEWEAAHGIDLAAKRREYEARMLRTLRHTIEKTVYSDGREHGVVTACGRYFHRRRKAKGGMTPCPNCASGTRVSDPVRSAFGTPTGDDVEIRRR